jgi:hypothetical protein
MRCLLGFGKGSNDSVLKCRICCRNLESRRKESSFFLNLVVQKVRLKFSPTKSEDYRISGVEDFRLKERIACKAKTLYFSLCFISSR